LSLTEAHYGFTFLSHRGCEGRQASPDRAGPRISAR